MKEITRRGARPNEGREVTPVAGVTIKSGRATIAMSIKRAGENAAFAEWLDRELEDIIKRSYQEFTAVNPADDTRG
jgi:ParB family chromosome partitioning protein